MFGATADEDLRDKVGRRQWKKNGRPVHWVGDLNAVGNVGKKGLGVGFDVIDHGGVACNDEHTSVGKCESPSIQNMSI